MTKMELLFEDIESQSTIEVEECDECHSLFALEDLSLIDDFFICEDCFFSLV